ncbi:hypothetical protein PV08_06627 [Exophiala spinifera]|uniref:Uncharacterized protein n=1 Tax=Exophiala spinifera TaxID=91928 RepID=A0A0D1ZLX7_9EURO|nr:uncharacterized protein PV08_06627 [Exophiala spinifera]KIW13847.1 hypothetical protein PV08_06627 [Exophiala spinifera]
MVDTVDARLLQCRLGVTGGNRTVKSVYGDKSWVEDLDIVNELGAHTGCVNALSWSRSGSLLASGSDDTYLNIWDYNPASDYKPFTLNTSVHTGHHANIFSVKFMPHSGDRTVVSCAGDSEVRVFDLEYAGAARSGSTASSFSTSTRSRRFNNFFRNARWLNEANTNARVYRSHADRVKRIITESSPHLFMTCSEDGEVRQWDLRQPSSAYPSPRGGRAYGDVPPPLISYKKYGLDLNTISCAASQPQYIALGGAHLHCFLHDRRMLGRDLEAEQGRPASRNPIAGTYEDESMAEATRCVKRFAPNNKRKMGLNDHGHITACKISDANPNEMVASWSGDYVYSFDIVKSPDAREAGDKADKAFQAARLRNRSEGNRKRTRANVSSTSLAEAASPSRRLRRVPDDSLEEGRTALLARYTDGNSELIPIPHEESARNVEPASSNELLLTEAQRVAEQVARSVVQLRKTLFDFSAILSQQTAASVENSSDLTPHTASFTTALGQCAALLPQMDEIIRTWSYPVNPSEDDVTFQNTLRYNRLATWRFVQGTGCLARTLGGTLQSLSLGPDVRLSQFHVIRPPAHEGKNISKDSQFCYDFLKAILLWIDGGQEAVLDAFKRPGHVSSDSRRFPLDDDDTVNDYIPKLESFLLELAEDDVPVVDIDTNRFERDDTRLIFPSQVSAVQTFIGALTNVKLQLNQGMSAPSEGTDGTTRIMDKGAAARFWGVKVGRSLLMRAGEGINFDFVNRVFGGLRFHIVPDSGHERSQEDVDPDEADRIVESLDVITGLDVAAHQLASGSSAGSPETVRDTTEESERSDVEMRTFPTVHVEDADEDEEGDEDEDEDDNPDDQSDSDERDSDDDDDEGEYAVNPVMYHRRVGGGFRQRATVNLHVPYSSHSRIYKGHCNTRTVKDVNFYGLNDEYVVSGSDDGHFFIWDRKTCKIMNILKGDGEVVNVVQGHPYEPMLAVSGIDSTVKIFGLGGDSRERYNAAQGIDVANPGGGEHSSLRFGGRRRRRRRMGYGGDDEDSGDDDDDEENGTSANGGLASRRAMQHEYTITSQNDAARRQGAGETFVTVGYHRVLAVRFFGSEIADFCWLPRRSPCSLDLLWLCNEVSSTRFKDKGSVAKVELSWWMTTAR